MKDVGIFKAIWSILLPFGIFMSIVYILWSFWYVCIFQF
jgi:hypothetical protein